MKPVPRNAVRPEVLEFPPDVGTRPDAPILLNWNESRWPQPPGLVAAIGEALAAADSRPYPDRVYPAVREGLARMVNWDPEGIVFGAGGDDMILLLALSASGPGASVIYPSPGFSMYPWAIRLAGAETAPAPLGDDLGYDLPGLARQIRELRPPLTFITNPHNPTGQLLPLDALRELAEATPGFLLVDEAYAEFAAWNARPLLDEYANVVLLRTFSKSMTMAGARLGYLAAQPEAADLLRRAQAPFPVGIYTALAAARAIEFRPALLELTARIGAERDRLAGALAALPGVSVWPSHANFLLFRTPVPSGVLSARVLARGVALRDFSRHPKLAGTLRVTVGPPHENAAFLDALTESLAIPVAPAELAGAAVSASPVA